MGTQNLESPTYATKYPTWSTTHQNGQVTVKVKRKIKNLKLARSMWDSKMVFVTGRCIGSGKSTGIYAAAARGKIQSVALAPVSLHSVPGLLQAILGAGKNLPHRTYQNSCAINCGEGPGHVTHSDNKNWKTIPIAMYQFNVSVSGIKGVPSCGWPTFLGYSQWFWTGTPSVISKHLKPSALFYWEPWNMK